MGIEIVEVRGDYHWLAGLIAIAVMALGFFLAWSKSQKSDK